MPYEANEFIDRLLAHLVDPIANDPKCGFVVSHVEDIKGREGSVALDTIPKSYADIAGADIIFDGKIITT